MNKLINADCIEVMKKLEDKSIDLILCDLPYGTTNCAWDIIIPFEELGITDSGKSRELKDASRLIMHRITELWEEGHAD